MDLESNEELYEFAAIRNNDSEPPVPEISASDEISSLINSLQVCRRKCREVAALIGELNELIKNA